MVMRLLEPLLHECPLPTHSKSPRTRGPEHNVTKAVTVREGLDKGPQKKIVLGPSAPRGPPVWGGKRRSPERMARA